MKTHRLHWRAGRTGSEWYSAPLTESEALKTEAAVSEIQDYRELALTATAEPLPVSPGEVE